MSQAIWHVQRFQSTKHFALKHMFLLLPSPSEVLFSYFEASVKQYCLRRLQKQLKAKAVGDHRHYTETHTCLSELSAIIWIIRIYNSLCASLQNTVGKLLLLTSFFDGGVVKSIEITSRPRSHTTSSTSFSMYIGTKFLSTKHERQTTILGWLNISRSKYEAHAYKGNLLYTHALTKQNAVSLPVHLRRHLHITLDLSRNKKKTCNLKNCTITFHLPSQHSQRIV
jgi:hypothetical protein